MTKEQQDLERMIKGMMQVAEKMAAPAAEFAKRARVLGRHLGLIPVDNSLRGRLRRRWNALREVWELRLTGALYVVFATATILGTLWWAYTMLSILCD